MNEEGAASSEGRRRRLPVGRRGFLKAFGGVGILGGASLMATAGGSEDTNMADTVGADLSFELEGRWRETLPDAEWSEHNRLPLLHDGFEGEGAPEAWTAASTDGPRPDVSIADGRFAVQADDDPAAGTWTRTVDIAAPWVAVAARIDEATDATAAFGVSRDEDNAVVVETDADGIEIATTFGGRRSVSRFGGDAPETPFEAMLVLMGDRASLLTRAPGDDWTYRGDTAWNEPSGVDLYDREGWARWDPCLRADVNAGGRAAFGDVRVFHTLQFGLRDPTVVTEPDGTPIVRDGDLYLTATCGSVDHRGYQVVLAMDVETYEFELRSALWAESVPGHVSNYVASHVMYDPDRAEFFQFWSGFGNGPHEPYFGQKCWVSRTEADVLDGIHVLECELMNLPRGWTGRQHDPFVIRDEEAGTWRCVHNENAVFRVSVSETDDDSFTGGWERVGTHRDYLDQIEGGKFARVGGDIALAYADEGSPTGMTLAAYPDPSSGRVPVDLDVPPGDEAPHPSIVPVPDDDGTRYLLLTMDGERVYGLGEPSHGALCVYEAVPPVEDNGSTTAARTPTRTSTGDPGTSSTRRTEAASPTETVSDSSVADVPSLDDRIRGAMYFPARTFNTYQTWAGYDAEETRRDLGYATRLDLNAIQVFASYEFWDENADAMERRLDDFFDAAAERGLAVLPILFESIGDRPTRENLTNRDVETAFAVHSPDRRVLRFPWRWGGPRSFVERFVDRYGDHEALLAVSIMNEPGEWSPRVDFCRSMLDAARATDADVPLTMGCKDLSYNEQYEDTELDVYQFHYNVPPTAGHMRDAIREAKAFADGTDKPVWLTEWQRTRETPPDKMAPNYESLAPVIRESDLDGDFLWQLLLKPAYMEKPRKRGRLNGVFHEDGVPYSATDAASVAGIEASGEGGDPFEAERRDWPAWTGGN